MLVWGPGEVGFAVSAYMGGTCGSGVLSSAGDVLEMSMLRGVGGVCDMCMCLAQAGWEVLGVSGRQDGIWALSILEEIRNSLF